MSSTFLNKPTSEKQKGSSILFVIIYLTIITSSIIVFTRTLSVNSATIKAESFNESALIGSSFSVLNFYKQSILDCLDVGYYTYINDTIITEEEIAAMSTEELESKCFDQEMVDKKGLQTDFDLLVETEINKHIDIFNDHNPIDLQITLNKIEDYDIHAEYDPTHVNHRIYIDKQTYKFDYTVKQLFVVPYEFEDINALSESSFNLSIGFNSL